jgi:acyl carrier protein
MSVSALWRSPRKIMGLDAVELVMAVEETFGIAIPEADAAKMITPAMMIEYVQNAVASCPERSQRWTNDEVRRVIRQIISEKLCVKNFNDTDEFVRDLGLD